MERPSPAILGSIVLHAGVLAFAFVSWPSKELPPIVPSSVPVSIVSSEVIEAAPADNPSEEVVTEDAASAPSAPAEAPPQPTPAPPTPAPAPPRPTPRPSPAPLRPAVPAPRPTPTPRPTPPRVTPPRPAPATPARPTPARPTPPAATPRRNEPTLDLSTLAQGPRRPGPTAPRATTGQQGAGRASQASGPQITAIFNQAYPNWPQSVCDSPGVESLRVQVDVSLSADGRITRGPTLVSPQSDPVYRTAADGVLRALRETSPFDVPAGFPGGDYRPSFSTARACRNR